MNETFTLYAQRQSPFCRKVIIMAVETGLIDDITIEEQQTSPVLNNHAVFSANPLGKVPILKHGDNVVLDSKHICDYLDNLHSTKSIYLADNELKSNIKNLEIVADGMSEAAILIKQEREREHSTWQKSQFARGQLEKINRSLSFLNSAECFFESDNHIGHYAFASAISFLTFSNVPSSLDKYDRIVSWFDAFNYRESMKRTLFEGGVDDGFIYEGLLKEARLNAF